MSSFKPSLRLVTPDGDIGDPLPAASDIKYLDDETAPGVIAFKYPANGPFADQLTPYQEVALFVDGAELPNSRARLIDFADNITDGHKITTWSGPTLLQRLEEGLVLPSEDRHLREDVLTEKERELLTEQKREWMQNAISKAMKDAKDQARSYAESQTPDGGGGGTHNTDDNLDGDTSQLRQRALDWAADQVSSPTQSWYRLCQSFVRKSYGFDGIFDTAAAAWAGGTQRFGTDYADIPAGVPVYFSPNHVVLSAGGGMCYSNDVCSSGDICYTSLSNISDGSWNLLYLGWSTTCSGKEVFP